MRRRAGGRSRTAATTRGAAREGDVRPAALHSRQLHASLAGRAQIEGPGLAGAERGQTMLRAGPFQHERCGPNDTVTVASSEAWRIRQSTRLGPQWETASARESHPRAAAGWYLTSGPLLSCGRAGHVDSEVSESNVVSLRWVDGCSVQRNAQSVACCVAVSLCLSAANPLPPSLHAVLSSSTLPLLAAPPRFSGLIHF